MEHNWEESRKKIIGLGDSSLRKSYYPELQEKIDALESNQKNLQSIISSISDGIVIHDREGKLLSMNKKAQDITGFDKIEGTKISFLPIIEEQPDNLDLIAVWEDVIRGESRMLECSIKNSKSGEIIFVQISLNQIIWNREKAVISVIRDFTERKKYEQKLIDAVGVAKSNEEKFRHLFHNMNSAFAFHKIITNQNGKPVNYEYIEVNPMFEDLTGLKAKDVVGKKVLDVLPNLEPIWIDKFGMVALTGESIEYTDYVKELGKYFKAKAYCPEIGYFAVTFNDVTSEVEQDKAIKESEEMYRTIVDLSPEGIITMSLTGTILTVNKSFLELAGYYEDSFVGKHFLSIPTLIPQDIKTYTQFFSRIVKGDTKRPVEFKWRHKSGEVHYGEARVAIIKKANNKFVQGVIRDVTETKLAHDKLKESEHRYNLAMSAVNEGIFDWYIKAKKIFFDSRYFTLAGYKPNEFAHDFSEWEKRVHPDDLEMSKDKVDEHLSGATEQFDIQFRFQRKDKTWMWIRGRGKIVERDGKGSPVRMIGTHTDITDQKVAEEAFREKSAEMENYFSNALDLFCIANAQGDFVRVNKAWEETLGYSVTELENRKFLDFVHPEDIDATLAAISQLEAQEKVLSFTNRYRRKDGNYRYIEWRSIPYVDLIYAAARDITERINLENELIHHKENLEMLVKDRTEELQALNEELKSINEELYDQRNELETTLERLQTAQKQLVESEKMASIGVLTSGIAHEINNPINFISSGVTGLELETSELIAAINHYSAQLNKDGLVDHKALLKEMESNFHVEKSMENIPKLIKAIRTGVDRTTSIIKGLRTFSRLDEENKIEANLNEIINSALTMLFNKYKNRIEVKTSFCEQTQINCYPGKLGQLFLNIILNAIQAIEGEGKIIIETQYIAGKNCYKVLITDTGFGIAEENLKRIFDPFYTTKPVGQGTGLGLAIVHGIVKDHNGQIDVKSELGKGTTFILYLPK